MIKEILILTIFAALVLTSCKEEIKRNNLQNVITEDTDSKESQEVFTSTSTDKFGNKLEMTFDDLNDKVIVVFNGEEIEMTGQKPASGIWYKNDNYELRGKGNDIELKKDGKTVFKHEDEIIKHSLKNEKGQSLELSFNNTTNTVTVFFNGGEQIDLIGQKAASGIWYKNDHYELRGKGDDILFSKDGKILYKN